MLNTLSIAYEESNGSNEVHFLERGLEPGADLAYAWGGGGGGGCTNAPLNF